MAYTTNPGPEFACHDRINDDLALLRFWEMGLQEGILDHLIAHSSLNLEDDCLISHSFANFSMTASHWLAMASKRCLLRILLPASAANWLRRLGQIPVALRNWMRVLAFCQVSSQVLIDALTSLLILKLQASHMRVLREWRGSGIPCRNSTRSTGTGSEISTLGGFESGPFDQLLTSLALCAERSDYLGFIVYCCTSGVHHQPLQLTTFGAGVVDSLQDFKGLLSSFVIPCARFSSPMIWA